MTRCPHLGRALLLNDLWSHPVWRTNDRILLAHCGGQLRGYTEVSKLHHSLLGQNVARFYVTVNVLVRVQVGQAESVQPQYAGLPLLKAYFQ